MPLIQTNSCETTAMPSCKLQQVARILAGLLLCLSFLVDTSHDPFGAKFPTYTTIIAIWACISSCGRTDKGTTMCSDTILTDMGTFVSVGAASLVFDVIFCSVWGPSLLHDSSTRLSFIVFAIQMAVKSLLLICAMRIMFIVRRSEEEKEVEPGSLSESCFADVEASISMEDGRKRREEDFSATPPPPPFSPGLPGLVSPAPILSRRNMETP